MQRSGMFDSVDLESFALPPDAYKSRVTIVVMSQREVGLVPTKSERD